ncbi:MAG: hypothetical protein L0Y68_06360 [Candidatus Dadabacteria bacterium]|nr:hypothetical protein [Candidatus Dadabacteria bacterium]
MSYKNTYIKDIENYFLNYVARGIMLSPKEYDLIMKWKARGVPKEVVYKGITKAIENCRKKVTRSEFPRSLVYYASFIEDEIRNYKNIQENKSDNIEPKPNDFIQRILDRLAKIITSEKRDNVRKHYVETRKRISDLLNSNDEDIFTTLENIEEEFYEALFQSLPLSEQERIISNAKEMINKRSRFMTKRAHRESVLSFRKEILKKDYELIKIISDDK